MYWVYTIMWLAGLLGFVRDGCLGGGRGCGATTAVVVFVAVVLTSE